MPADIDGQIAALPKLSLDRLRLRYAKLFGKETQIRNKSWLIKRIAWGIQATGGGRPVRAGTPPSGTTGAQRQPPSSIGQGATPGGASLPRPRGLAFAA